MTREGKQNKGGSHATAHALWEEGWYMPAHKVASPNFDLRPVDILPELVVIHSISLPPGEYLNGHIKALFLNELDWQQHPYFEKIKGLQVSSHFVIDRQGHVFQYVSCNQRAWHSGRSSWKGRDECNDWSIGVELEGLEGESFEPPQYQSLITLLNDVVAKYPIRWVAGHEHIAPNRKADPGAGFEWGAIMPHIQGLGAEAYPTVDKT